jgi:hypothetical protein
MRARVSWRQATWHDYDLGAESFDVVLCPFSAFQRNLTIEEQDRFLGLAREHLKPGGLLVIDVFFPNLARLAERREERHVTREFECGNEDWVMHESCVRYPASQKFEVRLDYEPAAGGETVEQVFDLTWFLPRELERMVSANDLIPEAILDGYGGGPVHDDSARQVVVARKGAG